MKMTFIGSGAAFTSNNYHSNILIESNDKKLLIDCGSDARFALRDLGYSYKDIDSIYISHIHADHSGGLEWLGFSRKFDASCTKPYLIAHENILNNLWEHSLSAGMQTLDAESATLATYFIPQYLDHTRGFQWENINFELVKTVHVKNNHHLVDSYGLFFNVNDKRIFLTTDTRMAFDQFLPYYEQSNIIFHDCETQNTPSAVHAHYNELIKLPLNIKNKMWLYHYNSGMLPNAQDDGFLGFVQKGQAFLF